MGVATGFGCKEVYNLARPVATAADKQPVNEAIVEKLCSKLDFRWLEQFSVFLRKSVNAITLFITRTG